MTVFKSFFKIANKRKASIVIPLLISAAFALLNRSSVIEKQEEFSKQLPNIVLINHDENSISSGLESYLEGKVIFESFDESEIEEALFYRRIQFALVIPEGYSQRFIEKGEVLNPEILIDSSNAYIAESYIQEYLSSVKALVNLGYSEELAVERVVGLKANDPSVSIHHSGQNKSGNLYVGFSTIEVYPIMFTLMSILIPSLAVFKVYGVKRRSEVAYMSSFKRNAILMASTVAYGHALWIFMKSFSIILLRDNIELTSFLYSSLNSYVFLWIVIALSFMVSEIAKTESSQIAITTVSSLGISFISGVFVPKELLSPAILSVAKLFPVYWNIEANSAIASGKDIVSTMSTPLIIQCLFAVVFAGIGLFVARNRKTRSGY
ncbi:ABC transporter permease [Erysipelothrix sp. HDW6A]|uniref:ABC transporter permease n=1 Tax=Erysipelothrix sp. HDW6A TaxID=2714928 RepID=UPI00140C31C7|nr:ABC transporter permease [Erysipelothrix sp. HDW6A]QIK58042.1 ABC transporter permease [Erysipelothrix sp. HDW6A]